MLGFDCDKDLTLDDSVFIQVYSGEEFVFSMPCNMRELKDLKKAVEKGIEKIQDVKDWRVITKTKKFWDECKITNNMPDMQKLLKEYREKKKTK